MKLILNILLIIFAVCTEVNAQKDCYKSLAFYKSEQLFVDQLESLVRNKDSSIIYFRRSNNVNFGIAAYKYQGQIVTFQVTEINSNIKIDSLPKEGKVILTSFFRNEVYNDTTSMPKRYYVDDGGYSNILFRTNSLCWLYQFPGMTKKAKREDWVADLYQFTWKVTKELNPLK